MKKDLSNQLKAKAPMNSARFAVEAGRHATPGLLIVGSVAYDSIATPFAKVDKTLGGSGSYISLAASYFTQAKLVGIVGTDFKAADRQKLQGKKIDVTGLQTAQGKTFHWAGKYSFDLNSRQTLKTELGVFADFKPSLSPTHKQSQYVFLGNIQPKLQLDVLKQMSRPKFVGLDTMNFWIEKTPSDLKKVLRQIDILVINDGEARELAKQHNLLKAAKGIRGMLGRNGLLIIKRGENGLLMFGYNQIFHLPGYPLEDVADPTGAGDSFAGGFMGYLAAADNISWANLKKACVAGSVMASFCCEKLGVAGLSNLDNKKIARRLKDFKTLTHFEI